MKKKYKKKHKTRCLECGNPIKEMVSLCKSCLKKEINKLEKGDLSGYSYATKEYFKRRS